MISGIFWLKLRDLSKNLIQRLKKDCRCCWILTFLHSKRIFILYIQMTFLLSTMINKVSPVHLAPIFQRDNDERIIYTLFGIVFTQFLVCFGYFLFYFYQFLFKNHISRLYYEFVYFSVISGIFWLKLRDLSKNLIQRLKKTADAIGL